MSNQKNTKVLRLSSHDEDSYGFLDYYLTRWPKGNLQIYMDDVLILDIQGHEKADYDDLNYWKAS